MFSIFCIASAGQQVSNPKKKRTNGLDKDGIEQCGYIGRAMAALNVRTGYHHRPLKRATQTAALVGNEMGHEGKLVIDSALRPEATFADFSKDARKMPVRMLCWLLGTTRICATFWDA